jgi:hypothetical protein
MKLEVHREGNRCRTDCRRYLASYRGKRLAFLSALAYIFYFSYNPLHDVNILPMRSYLFLFLFPLLFIGRLLLIFFTVCLTTGVPS